jgi:hypothetical protein
MKGPAFILVMMTCLLVMPAGGCYVCESKTDPLKTEQVHTSGKEVCCGSSSTQKSCSLWMPPNIGC